MNPEIKSKIDRYVMNTYGRSQVTFVRGQGAMLYDDQGKAYHDFLAGIAVANLGHAHPGVSQAVCNQVLKLSHVSNLFYTEPQARVAELLVNNSFADRVFFCNSGAEANEGAIKLTRLWGKKHLNGAYEIITMHNSFHGRTMKTLAATGQPKVQKGFDPLAPGFKYAPFGDLAALKEVATDQTCAVMVEPVQGEGGVRVPPDDYLPGLCAFCAERGLMLIYDEIQTGLGRTGKLFAHEHWNAPPMVMTLAKGLANGLPAGAILASGEAAELFTPGTHATTFGAGPVIMEAARVVLETLTSPGFLAETAQKGQYFKQGLEKLAQAHPDKVAEVRGLGLILGLELKGAGVPLVQELLARGFVANCTQDKVLRFLPPLVVESEQIDALVSELDQILAQWSPQ
jgi:predicted acetylornithine/succinylornithine family transaminase